MAIASKCEDYQQRETWEILPLTLRVAETFEEFVRLNPELDVEQKSNGEIVIMSPVGGESSDRNAEITFQLRLWSKKYGGFTFDSSVIFCLPDGSKRSPDASWVASNRWLGLSKEERKKFPPICPDFVIELRSESDTLQELQDKMNSYLSNGILLGWLIDPFRRQIHVYQPGKPVEILTSPETVSNNEVLHALVLDLNPIWNI